MKLGWMDDVIKEINYYIKLMPTMVYNIVDRD